MSQKNSKSPLLLAVGMMLLLSAVESHAITSRNTIVRKPILPDTVQSAAESAKGNLLSPPALLLSPDKGVATLPSKNSLRNVIVATPTNFASSQGDLTLPTYIDLILQDNFNVLNGNYEAKLDQLQNLMDQSRYDFDLSFQALLSANQLPTPTEGMGTTLTGRIGFQANKLLYDGSRHYYMNENVSLNERLAKFKKLSAKDQVTLYGAELYLQLLELQGRKNYMQRYQDLTDKFYRMTMQKVESGVSDNVYDQINVKIDKLAFEKLVLGLQFDLYNATISFKQAANMRTNEELILAWPHITPPVDSVEVLQKKAMEKNPQVEVADLLFRLKQGEILTEEGRNDWLVNLNSFAGVGYSNTVTDITDSASQGMNWAVTLQAAYPLDTGNKHLAVEKKMVEALKEKNNRSILQHNTILRVNKLFIESERETQMLQLLSVQKEIVERQLKIARYRFEGGVDPYAAYAAAMKRMIEVEEGILSAKIRQARNVFELRILTGGSEQ